jgi:hypothetical protein
MKILSVIVLTNFHYQDSKSEKPTAEPALQVISNQTITLYFSNQTIYDIN